VPAQAPSTRQPWLYAALSQNTVVQCGLDPATQLIDTQLHSSMCLISGCLQPMQLSWLPVRSNVAPLSLRRKAATTCFRSSKPIQGCPQDFGLAALGEENFENLTTKWCILKYI